MKTHIDSAGRIVIPKQIRTQARLETGMELEVNVRNGIVEICAPLPEVTWVNFKGIEFPEIDSPGLTADEIRAAIEESRDGGR